MRIIPISIEDPRWPEFVVSQQRALIYHHPLWIRVIRETYGHEPASLAAERPDGTIIGVLPLMRTRGLSTGIRLASLPHTPIAGPLAVSREVERDLIQAAIQAVSVIPRAALQLKTIEALPGAMASLKTVAWDSSFVLEIPSKGNEIRFGNARQHSRVSWSVRRSERLGCKVSSAESMKDLHEWYELYLQTMQPKVVPPRPFRFFRIAWDLLRPSGMMRLLLVRNEQNKIAAGVILFAFGQTVFYAFNGRRGDQLSLRPNDLLQWHAIHDAQSAGYHFYDFGEVEADDEGLADFKRKWGARPQQLWRHYHPCPREAQSSLLLKSGAARRLFSAAWRSLPVKATGVLGGWIYSYL